MIFLAYIRLVSYAVVLISSAISLKRQKYSAILFVGDMVLAMGFLLAILGDPFGSGVHHLIPTSTIRNFIITPSVTTWALFHFINLIRR
jgi:hypothetical protein